MRGSRITRGEPGFSRSWTGHRHKMSRSDPNGSNVAVLPGMTQPKIAEAEKPIPVSTSATAGLIAGFLNALLVGPLDVVKARQQIQRRLLEQSPAEAQAAKTKFYKGTLNSLRRIYTEEGFRGLYRGFEPTLIGYVPTWAIYFTLYNRGRDQLALSFPAVNHHFYNMGAAVFAGACTNLATNPIWVIRTRLQTQDYVTRAPEYLGTLDTARKMIRKEGIKSLYKGMVPNMWGLVHVAVQFPLYEKLKSDLEPNTKSHSAWVLLTASSSSKILASTFTYPLEVIRTRMHVQRSGDGKPHYTTVPGAFKTIIREEGVRGLYSGLRTNLIRVVPACAVTFTSFEFVVHALEDQQSLED